MSQILSVNGLSMAYTNKDWRRNTKVLNDIGFELAQGQILAIVGESGSGKSSLAKCLMGLQTYQAGEIFWRGQCLPKQFSRKDLRRYAGTMQMVFQDPGSSLNPRMTVLELLSEGLCIRDGGNAERYRTEVEQWLDQVGLSANMTQRYAWQFSGGQRQRLAIARALILAPQVLICDEAVSALDVSVQAQIVNLLKSLCRKTNTAMIFIAHDLAIVRHIADRVLVMHQGKIVEQGDAQAIFQNPQDSYTQALMAAVLPPVPAEAVKRLV